MSKLIVNGAPQGTAGTGASGADLRPIVPAGEDSANAPAKLAGAGSVDVRCDSATGVCDIERALAQQANRPGLKQDMLNFLSGLEYEFGVLYAPAAHKGELHGWDLASEFASLPLITTPEGPVVRAGDAWTFDVEAGAEEIVLRRIGRNELSAIEVCRAIGDAQEEYRAMFGHYAARLLSRDGQRDGLYWPTSEDEPLSPLGELVAAAAEGAPTPSEDGERAPYLGYHYRILVEKGPSAPGGPGTYASDGALQGGYAILAWPADYASLGIMTFLMDARGVVLERDLGERTSETASALSSYDPTSECEVCAN